MYLLLTDETNLPNDPRARFFAYGGLIIPHENSYRLHELIKQARQHNGYAPEDVLKFNTATRPDHVTVDQAATAKRSVIEACNETGCKFIVYVVLHDIARNTELANLVDWGANQVIGKFNYFLTCSGSNGIVVVDRLPQNREYNYLAEKFTSGLTLQENQHVDLDRITLFASTCINSSHFSSAVDVVLGSFRYCINDPPNQAAAETMMLEITKLIWHEREGDQIYAFEKGLIFRPRQITVARYQREYDRLLAHINNLIRNG